MEQYQRDFLDHALEKGVLQFGEFQLKSDRVSPYFFNAGNFSTGTSSAILGEAYAIALAETFTLRMFSTDQPTKALL